MYKITFNDQTTEVFPGTTIFKVLGRMLVIVDKETERYMFFYPMCNIHKVEFI